MKRVFFTVFTYLILSGLTSNAAEWQWSIPVRGVISAETNDHPRAFLWIPPNCKHVRGVVVGQHNMLEEGILEHAAFRRALTDLGFAEVWITPGLNLVFRFDLGAGEQFDGMMKDLGDVSGYTSLQFAPVVPIGHSAAASYPWNFAAWNPGRTLAILSIHGDAPLTDLTGSGQPNPDWGRRTVDGIPALMVMGEYEWWENRLSPALKYRREHPSAPISLLADAGRGHFDYSDGLVAYLALFLKKAAAARLPKEIPLSGPVPLTPVKAESGWLADRWHPDAPPAAAAAPYRQYNGDNSQSFWYFDKEMTAATERYYAKVRGKKPQYISFLQHGVLPAFDLNSHARIAIKFKPAPDGVTFNLSAAYTDTLRQKLVTDHSKSKISITRICGPVVKINDTTFAVRFYRMGFNSPKRTGDVWLMAASDGDGTYKSTVQQLNMRIPVSNTEGEAQQISFPAIGDVTSTAKTVRLNATSDRHLPVYYYVQDGPAEVNGDKLVLTRIPPGSKYPVKVTVVAWQYGSSVAPKTKSAVPVTQHFYIRKSPVR